MRLIKSISSKLILPAVVVLLSLFSCSKGEEPIPTANVDSTHPSASSMLEEETTNQSFRMMDVVGGDDHEDDDDNKESDLTSRGGR